jgi:hypothetical protein
VSQDTGPACAGRGSGDGPLVGEIEFDRQQRRADTGEALPGVARPARSPDVRCVVRDRWAELRLVAAGLAVTTIPPVASHLLPHDVHAVAVRGGSREIRRLMLGHRPGPLTDARRRVGSHGR